MIKNKSEKKKENLNPRREQRMMKINKEGRQVVKKKIRKMENQIR